MSVEPLKSFYSTLDLERDASRCSIRSAYKKLAMKWHPDKHRGVDRLLAKTKFQEVQEAYAVLSDDRRKALYDNGLYDPGDDEEDIEGLSSFISEMAGMMSEAQPSQEGGKGETFEDLQQLFVDMFSADLASFSCTSTMSSVPANCDKKREWAPSHGTGPLIDEAKSYAINEAFQGPGQHFVFDGPFEFDSAYPSTSKKMKNTMQYTSGPGLSSSSCLVDTI